MQLVRMFIALVFAFLASFAYAVDPTLVDITTAISVSSVLTAVVAMAGLIVSYRLLKQGAVVVLRFLGWIR